MDAGAPALAPTTLRLRRPIGATFVLTAAIVALVAAAAEGLARTDAARRSLPTPSVGCGQPQLDLKLAALSERTRLEGPVEGLYFGSSMVLRGIDPAIVGDAFRPGAGRDLRSFNFGLNGLSGRGEAPLARLLVGEFGPRWMVIGVSPFALDDDRGVPLTERLLASPWIRHHEGARNLDGWLVDRSAAFRAWLGLRFWVLDPYGRADRQRHRGLMEGLRPDGYGYSPPGPLPALDEKTVAYFSSYEVSAAQLSSLSATLELARTLPVVLVEIPVHDRVVRRFGRGDEAYRLGLESIERTATAAGVPFWRYPVERAIPDEGWANYTHLNATGAKAYSRWLGERLGEAAREGLR